jgi:yecA family protein
MEQTIDHDALEDALRRCGATWDAAQVHGLLSGRLATTGAEAGFEWLALVLDGTDTADALRKECEVMLSTLFETTLRQLSERLSEFSLLLPDDEESVTARATALAHWCEGFLHGLVSASHGEALKKRLGEDPLADIIKDMLQITRAGEDDDGGNDEIDAAYTELVEYVRVAAQVAYEELASLRHPQDEIDDPTPAALH